MFPCVDDSVNRVDSFCRNVFVNLYFTVIVWSIANAKTISNNYGEIKIDKDITTERIDPIDAIIDAWKHAMKEEYRPDVNETVNEWLEQYEKYRKAVRNK